MSGFRVAMSFLTRVPVDNAVTGDRDIARSVAWFPVVGALVGGCVAIVYAGALQLVPALAAAAVALGAGVLLTGAFHEDGFGDMADAFGGGRDRADVLRIMKDPRHGTYGVLAIVLSLLVRAAAISGLDGWGAVAIVPSAHALSRAAAVGSMLMIRPAAEDGLGATYARAVEARRVWVALAFGTALGVALMGWWALPAVLCAAAGAAIVGILAVRKIGGLTGDVLGSAQQVAEMLILLGGVAAVAAGWARVPWWR